MDCAEALKAENESLRDEIDRLKDERDQLKKALFSGADFVVSHIKLLRDADARISGLKEEIKIMREGKGVACEDRIEI